MTVRHVMIPGLARRHVDAWNAVGWPGRTPDRIATLTCSFPFSIETVEATLLTGVEPIEHGVWNDASSPPPGVNGLESVEHVRDDRLLDALVRAGFGSADERAAMAALVDRLRPGDADELLITGGPALHPVRLRIDPDGVASGCMAARFEPITASERDAVLARPEVERVLEGNSLHSWRAPRADAVVVLTDDAAYGDGAVGWGRRDRDDGPDAAVVLAWGARARWPRTVHDHRIAPTLAAAVGASYDAAIDDPLPWS